MEGKQIRCGCSSCSKNHAGKSCRSEHHRQYCHDNNPLWNQNINQELRCQQIRNNEKEPTESFHPENKTKNTNELYKKLKTLAGRSNVFFGHKIIDIFKLIILLALLISPSPTLGTQSNGTFCNFTLENWTNRTEMHLADRKATYQFGVFNLTMQKYISPERYTYDMLHGRTYENLKVCLESYHVWVCTTKYKNVTAEQEMRACYNAERTCPVFRVFTSTKLRGGQPVFFCVGFHNKNEFDWEMIDLIGHNKTKNSSPRTFNFQISAHFVFATAAYFLFNY